MSWQVDKNSASTHIIVFSDKLDNIWGVISEFSDCGAFNKNTQFLVHLHLIGGHSKYHIHLLGEEHRLDIHCWNN